MLPDGARVVDNEGMYTFDDEDERKHVSMANPITAPDLHNPEMASFRKEFDDMTEEYYYVNTDTGETFWELPEGLSHHALRPVSDQQLIGLVQPD